MASQALTEYERRRLENIRRNEEMMASLKLYRPHGKVEGKAPKVHQSKNRKPEAPVELRRSLRNRRIPPDSSSAVGVEDDLVISTDKISKSPAESEPSPRVLGPLSMKDANSGDSFDRQLVDTIVNMSENGASYSAVRGTLENAPVSTLNLESLRLKRENIGRVVAGRILNVCFFPTTYRLFVVAGNISGHVGFWDVDCQGGEGNGIYVYRPHSAPISGIVFPTCSLSKVFTSCHGGLIRLLDVEKESFDLVYSSEDSIFSLSQHPHDAKILYFGEGEGGLNIWDERAGKSSSSWMLHEQRINSIDFSPVNNNLMATSSTDGTACIWDVRSINPNNPKFLKIVDHKRAVYSAYFSPSGNCLATTSVSDEVGVLRGVEFADVSMIHHKNCMGRRLCYFRAIWGWDDSYVFIGNTRRGVDVISTTQRRSVMTLESPHLSAIPCRFARHPYKVGILAGATGGGQVYIWTSSWEDARNDPVKAVTFGDGTPLPSEIVYDCLRIMDHKCVAIPWQKGDVLLIDNLAVLHSGRTYKPPRRILASLCK